MNYLVSLLKEIYSKRRLILDLAKSDFKKRFVGSYFGIAWMFLQPMATILVYFFVFQMGFKSVPPVPGYPYVLWLIPGIVPWFYFSEILILGTGCLQEYNYLVKKVVFRVEILPVIKMLSCFMVHGIFTLIMILVFFFYGEFPKATWIQILYYSFASSMISLAIAYFTSAIQVFFKDMAQIIGICLQFGMWMVPIMWAPEMFKNTPTWLPFVLKLNPFYYIVAGYRDSMLTGNWLIERPILGIYFWSVTIVLMLIGLKTFKKLRPHFSDVL
ncbi:ABC transporter permease [Clostridium sp. E02]|uniref:ABC transporter permease n=1 Tax=Clostridium sp. E02 TaxID=2487134 RepID=UPI000F52DA84|nr:ABC transporter permease [Clostridium sp. E02]